MEFKKTNYCLLAIVALLLFTTLLLFIKLLVTGEKGLAWGSISDWLTFACNAVMAFTALYAASLAKNWLKPNLQQQGLPKIVLFLQSELTPIISEETHNINSDLIIDEIEHLRGCVNFFAGEKQRRYAQAINNINEVLCNKTSNRKNLINIRQFDSKIQEFSWYGYEFINEKYVLIREIYTLKNKIHAVHSKISAQVDILTSEEFKKKYIQCTIKNESEVTDSFQNIIKNLTPLSRELDNNYKQLSDKYITMMGNSPMVTDFFIMKK